MTKKNELSRKQVGLIVIKARQRPDGEMLSSYECELLDELYPEYNNYQTKAEVYYSSLFSEETDNDNDNDKNHISTKRDVHFANKLNSINNQRSLSTSLITGLVAFLAGITLTAVVMKPEDQQKKQTAENSLLLSNKSKLIPAKSKYGSTINQQLNIPLTEKLPIYIKFGSTYVLATKARSFDQFDIQSSDNEFVKLTSHLGIPVWISSQFLDDSESKNTVLTSNNVNLRLRPEITKDNLVGRLNIGDKVKVIKVRGDWALIKPEISFQLYLKRDEINSTNKVLTVIEKTVKD